MRQSCRRDTIASRVGWRGRAVQTALEPIIATSVALRCPSCNAPITVADDACPQCGRALRTAGVLDFVSDPERDDERAHYDAVYAAMGAATERTPLAALEAQWTSPTMPQYALALDRLGDLRGKRVLLVGNGSSAKELWLLTRGVEWLVLSDLSAHGVARIRDGHDLGEHADRVVFAAMDALSLPLADGSVDVVFGCQMVHHLPDVPAFLAEVARVLAPGGRAVFVDTGYSPLWHGAKQSALRPLMAFSHWRTGISPEDLRFTESGGFREEVLGDWIREVGGAPWFERVSLLQYLWHRGAGKVLPGPVGRFVRTPRFSRPLNRVDASLAHLGPYRRNQIRLVWGMGL